MGTRKLQFTGGSTYTVSLPKKWVESLGLEKGDEVEFLGYPETAILKPAGKTKALGETKIVLGKEILSRAILSRYLSGYGTIKIESASKIPSETKREIKKIIGRLLGLQIVEETAYEIAIQDILNPQELDLKKAVKRAYSIAASMQKDAVEALREKDRALAEEIIQRDEEVDRLYFLAVRQLRSALSNPALGITPVECLDYRLLVKSIEEMADSCCTIARKALETNRKYDLSNISGIVNEIHEKAVHAYFARDVKAADGLRALEAKAAEIKDANTDPKLSPILDELLNIAQCGIDIGDLVI